MAAFAIQASGLSKRYEIGRARSNDTLRDALAHGVRGVWSRFNRSRRESGAASTEFWALRDVSFEVSPGEVAGIIGRNGAGKSTLLKILSRITEPTHGRVAIRGRVASLLEVGTGFHPELSGRENILLNGAILGMTRNEIRAKFDEIVAFAEIGAFLDTPVKRYSSGMYVRLAFSVAAHLEPEIFIVDEVLAVGDAAFQRKCLGKMNDVAQRHGRTVILVTHNMDSIVRLCQTALVLGGGRVQFKGRAEDAVGHYMKAEADPSATIDYSARPRPDWARRRHEVVRISHLNPGETPWRIPFAGSLEIQIETQSRSPIADGRIFLAIFSATGAEVGAVQSLLLPRPGGGGGDRYRCRLEDIRLNPGVYAFTVGVRADMGMEDHLEEAFHLEILSTEETRAAQIDAFSGYYAPRNSFSRE